MDASYGTLLPFRFDARVRRGFLVVWLSADGVFPDTDLGSTGAIEI